MGELVRYDAMCRAIDAAYEVDEVKQIHDQAQMLQAAARVAKNHDAEMRAYEIRMRAARKTGQLTKKIEKAQGQRRDLGTSGGNPQKSKVLEKAGIALRDASDWERLSEVPDERFEEALATKSVDALLAKSLSGRDADNDQRTKERSETNALMTELINLRHKLIEWFDKNPYLNYDARTALARTLQLTAEEFSNMSSNILKENR